MRWNSKDYADKPSSRFRIRKTFLFLPKEINGEVRWFEVATYRQFYEDGKWWDVQWLSE